MHVHSTATTTHANRTLDHCVSNNVTTQGCGVQARQYPLNMGFSAIFGDVHDYATPADMYDTSGMTWTTFSVDDKRNVVGSDAVLPGHRAT